MSEASLPGRFLARAVDVRPAEERAKLQQVIEGSDLDADTPQRICDIDIGRNAFCRRNAPETRC